MLEKLQTKRTLLVAQRDQLNANLNATLGAIAMMDELIGEELAAASLTKSAEVVVEIAAAVVDDRENFEKNVLKVVEKGRRNRLDAR